VCSGVVDTDGVTVLRVHHGKGDKTAGRPSRAISRRRTGRSYPPFHDLRRTVATALASVNVDPLLVCDWQEIVVADPRGERDAMAPVPRRRGGV